MVTEVLYTVHAAPETLAAVVPVWVSSKADLQAVEAAATSHTGRRFQFGLYSLYYWRAARKPWELPLISFGQLLLWLQVSCAEHSHEQNILGWLGKHIWGDMECQALRSYL